MLAPTMPESTTQKTTFAAIDELRRQLRGELLQPGDAGYDAARAIWNGMFDRHPALIARCVTPADVTACIAFARTTGLPLAVRGGGHNVAGHATVDDGLVIDLGAMNWVEVDAEQCLVHAGGGATIGDLDAATQAHGLAVPMGAVSATGIAGLTLGGGYGHLRNRYGLSCDNLIAAEVVTADGRIVTASEHENPDLLWGLRGGGGNFGVVTRFTFRAHPVGPEVMFTFVFHDGRNGGMNRALRFFRDFTAGAPDAISLLAACGRFPALSDHFPAELHNVPFVLLCGMYAGPADEGERAMHPLRTFAAPLLDYSGVMPYVDAQRMFDPDYPNGMRYYWKSLNLMRLDDAAIDLIAARAQEQPSPFNTTDLWHIGGAVKRVGGDASAFHGRHTAYVLNPEANWHDPADDSANIAWVRSFFDAMAPYSDGSRYLNFAGFQEEGDALMRQSFGPHYARLAALKAKYDPNNLFRRNANIRPARWER